MNCNTLVWYNSDTKTASAFLESSKFRRLLDGKVNKLSDSLEQSEMKLAAALSSVYKTVQAVNIDYQDTSFDRGHLNPSFYQCGDARVATFTLTNGVPQNPCFNQQEWVMMEEASKRMMKEKCDFPGAKRYFVTGSVPTPKKIPDRVHDSENDRIRDYNRVSVPSHMWTAVCCDSTSSTLQRHRTSGFSYGYIGTNTADVELNVISVEALERTLIDLYRRVDTINFGGVIFRDDKCNDKNSSEIRKKIEVRVGEQSVNQVHRLSASQQSALPSKKRKLIADTDLAFKRINLGNFKSVPTLSDVTYGIEIPCNEVEKVRAKFLSETRLSLVHVFTQNIQIRRYSKDELKRSSEESACPTQLFNVVPEQRYANITVGGTRCRVNHQCGFHGKHYRWCYTDWSNNWDHCCVDQCMFGRHKDYQWCQTSNSRDRNYCSERYSMVTVGGIPCLQEHECGLHGKDYHWCYTDVSKNWDYCCQPWHQCKIHPSKLLLWGVIPLAKSTWCYTGRRKETNWRRCLI